MDMYEFINSKDIANHFKEIDFKPSMPEASFLVYQSRSTTLEQKMDAWLEIANTMSDCGMPERTNMSTIPSFKTFLYEYVALKKREVTNFFVPDNCIYNGDYDGGGYGDEFFSTAQQCIDYLEENLSDDARNITVEIQKRPINEDRFAKGGTLYLDGKLHILDVQTYGESDRDCVTDLQFEGMWFKFPTPFKRGDIVRDVSLADSPVSVLNCLCTWSREDCLANGLDEDSWYVKNANRLLEAHSKNGDTSDLWWDCYSMCNNGLQVDGAGPSYLNIERCDEKLDENAKWAEVISAHLRHQVSFDDAINLLHYLDVNNKRQELQKRYDSLCQYQLKELWQKIR